MRLIKTIFGIFCAVLFIAVPASALEDPKADLQEVGVFTELGRKVDTSLIFSDSLGNKIPLSQVFSSGKPVILIPAYYRCPRLCGLILGGVQKLLNKLTLNLGHDFQVVTVSFDPEEGVKDAAEKASEYRKVLPDRGVPEAWSFLVGDENNIRPLMDQIGFRYKKDGSEFAHSAAIMILTPDGEISQYFTGIDFSPFDVKLSLIEASKGKIGSPLDHVFMFCFRFDETKGRYTWAVFNLMRLGAIATLVFLVVLIVGMRVKELADRK